MRKAFLCVILLSVISVLVLTGCYLFSCESASGEADRTEEVRDYMVGAPPNNLINANVERGEDWEQFVFDSPFQLGEFIEIEPDVHAGRKYKATYGTYPFIEGSTVCIPMGAEFARQHLDFSDNTARDIADYGTTPVAYDRLIDRHMRTVSVYMRAAAVDERKRVYIGPQIVDLILVTEPSDDELSRAKEAGIELVITPICWDAFVFITHKDNPVNSLTIEQIRKIYTGEITNWSEVGGLDQEIVAYQRTPNSGSQTTMEKQVMNGLPLIPAPMARIAQDMGSLVSVVSEYVNEQYSIGYTFKYYIDNLYRNNDIKVIAVDGIDPTDDNIRSKSYPFTTNYYAVYRSEDSDGVAGQFTAWIISEEGQRCVAQAGYIPLNP